MGGIELATKLLAQKGAFPPVGKVYLFPSDLFLIFFGNFAFYTLYKREYFVLLRVKPSPLARNLLGVDPKEKTVPLVTGVTRSARALRILGEPVQGE